MVAAAVDTAVVAKVVAVASEEATRNSLIPIAFVTTAKFARRGMRLYALVIVLKPRRIEASKYGINAFDKNLGRAGFEPAKA